MSFLSKVFGDSSSREIKRIKPLVDKIVALRPQMMNLSDDQLREKTEEFKSVLKKFGPAPVK